MKDKSFELLEKLYIRMEEGFARVDERFVQVDERFTQVDGTLTGIQKDIVRIENNHGAKLDALFDGYKANTEAIQELKGEVQVLKKEVETHEVKLKIVQ